MKRSAALSLFAAAWALLGTPSVAADTPHLRVIEVAGGVVRVGDIASGSRYSDLVVAILPRGEEAVELTAEAQRILLRGRVPGQPLALRHEGVLQIRRLVQGASEQPRRVCAIASADISADTFLSSADVEYRPCDDALPKHRITYQLLGSPARTMPYARNDIPGGSNLGAIRVPRHAPLAGGSTVLFRAGEGHAVVEREVVTLQPALAGRRLFARTQDGEVIVSLLVQDTAEATR